MDNTESTLDNSFFESCSKVNTAEGVMLNSQQQNRGTRFGVKNMSKNNYMD